MTNFQVGDHVRVKTSYNFPYCKHIRKEDGKEYYFSPEFLELIPDFKELDAKIDKILEHQCPKKEVGWTYCPQFGKKYEKPDKTIIRFALEYALHRLKMHTSAGIHKTCTEEEVKRVLKSLNN